MGLAGLKSDLEQLPCGMKKLPIYSPYSRSYNSRSPSQSSHALTDNIIPHFIYKLSDKLSSISALRRHLSLLSLTSVLVLLGIASLHLDRV
jgi:hypothetical protein